MITLSKVQMKGTSDVTMLERKETNRNIKEVYDYSYWLNSFGLYGYRY